MVFSLRMNNQMGSKEDNKVGPHLKDTRSERIQISDHQCVLPNGFNHCISSFRHGASKVTVYTLHERREFLLKVSFKHVPWLRSLLLILH